MIFVSLRDHIQLIVLSIVSIFEVSLLMFAVGSFPSVPQRRLVFQMYSHEQHLEQTQNNILLHDAFPFI